MEKLKKKAAQIVWLKSSERRWQVSIDDKVYGVLFKSDPDEWEFCGFPGDVSWDCCLGAETWGMTLEKAKRAALSRIREALLSQSAIALRLAEAIEDLEK